MTTSSLIAHYLHLLTPSERLYLDRVTRRDPALLWMPQNGPQWMALLSLADELYYGGAAGGGKSDLLLGLALQLHQRSMIFRREYPQLKDLVERSRELLAGTDAQYNGQQNVWRNIPGGRRLEFAAVQYEQDVNKFQGRPNDFRGFDEIPNFTERQYLFLSGWVRTTDPEQRTRIVCAGNPPTDTDGEWVIRRWAAWLDGQHSNPAQPGELRWYAMVDNEEVEREDHGAFDWKGEVITPKSRTFIPARLDDNPFLAQTGYGAQLQALPEPLRSQLLYGDFGIGVNDDPWQVIPTEWVRLAQKRWEDGRRPNVGMTALGVDVARGGDDETVIAPLYGHWLDRLLAYPGKATPDGFEVAGQVVQAQRDNARIGIDVIGVGASPYDILRNQGANVQGINFAEASEHKDKSGRLRMVNVRAAAYWMLREALDPQGDDRLALPPGRDILADLCALRFKVTARGIQVEAKDDVKKRLGRSPDKGDAIALALWAAYMGGPAILFEEWG